MARPPTLVLLARAPVLGRVKTRLAAEIGAHAALEAHRRLTERQVAARPPGWPLEIHVDPPGSAHAVTGWLGLPPATAFDQSPGDLGQRLAHAAAGAFSRGAGSVCVIGSDCPVLDPPLFAAAGQALLRADLVIVPAEDGGYALLGLHAAHLAIFEGIPWSTPGVADATRAAARRHGWSLAGLPAVFDVDDAAGWQRAQPFLHHPR